MQKGVRGIQNVAFLKYATEFGLVTAYNILAGFPGEDPFEYERMAREIPKFVHFRPPNGLFVVEFHRFSPYHSDAKRFGICLRPDERYSLIYPLDEEEIADIAYFFELGGRFPFDLSYISRLTDAINQWISEYRADHCVLTWRREGPEIVINDRRPGFGPRDYRLRNHAVAVFEALDAPTSLQIAIRTSMEIAAGAPITSVDIDGSFQRPGQRGSLTSLPSRARSGVAPGVSTTLLWTAPIAGAAISERVISFTGDQFARDAAGCLQGLTSTGIVYSDEGLYLTLPVHEDYREVEAGWGRIGI
jgi:hypothetical protein